MQQCQQREGLPWMSLSRSHIPMVLLLTRPRLVQLYLAIRFEKYGVKPRYIAISNQMDLVIIGNTFSTAGERELGPLEEKSAT